MLEVLAKSLYWRSLCPSGLTLTFNVAVFLEAAGLEVSNCFDRLFRHFPLLLKFRRFIVFYEVKQVLHVLESETSTPGIFCNLGELRNCVASLPLCVLRVGVHIRYQVQKVSAVRLFKL